MIDFNKHGIEYDPSSTNNVRVNDLIALGNISKVMTDTKVVEDGDTFVVIKGKYQNLQGNYAVMGGEVVYIQSSTLDGDNTKLILDRGLEGTLQENQEGYNFRTVLLIDKDTDISLIDWTFEDTIGSVTNNLFPCELGNGSITISSNIREWSPMLSTQKYFVRTKKTVAYIFKGVGDKRFLKHTTIVTKIDLNSKSRSETSRVKLEIKSKLAYIYDRDVAVNTQFKGVKPKEFFRSVFSLEDYEVYYAQGVSADSFLNINNLHTKEYKKIYELLKAYCSNGVRFCFDSKERVKIFSDFKVSDIETQKVIYEDIISPTLTTNEQMVYNTIDTEATQRLAMYDYAELGNRAVSYTRKLDSAVSSDALLTKDGDVYTINMLEIHNKELHTYSQIGSIVSLKRIEEPMVEIFAKVVDIGSNTAVFIYPITSDKDIMLFDNGKAKYLYDVLNLRPCGMDLYFARQQLPMVSKFTRNIGGKEEDSKLMYPLLPRVDGVLKYKTEIQYEFGCASNLPVGSYTGITEEIEGIYGTWTSDKLLYNREVEQFNGYNPPIALLTNKVAERVINSNTFTLDYISFDNSDVVMEMRKPTKNDGDAEMILYNNLGVNSSVDIGKDKEKGRIGNRTLIVDRLDKYRVGDVLVLEKPSDLNALEEKEYEEVLTYIRWRVTRKIISDEGTYYIEVDSDFPKRSVTGKVYEYLIYPNWSIIYVQEMYIRGNPLLEFKQKVTGVAKDVNFDGIRSVDVYGEKKYTFDAKFLDKNDMAIMMGYVLDNFQAVDINTTKFNVPISTYNGIDIELLDVISVEEPTYTGITDTSKWLVVSITSNCKTNVVQLKLLNVNKTDAKAFKIDIKDMLEFTPVDIPTYDHNGNEGGDDELNDGLGGEGKDSTLGTFQLAVVDPSIFRASIERIEGGYIYFDSFAGSEWEKYVSKLFPRAEFGISIQGETILMRSDSNYRAYIRKRDIYENGFRAIIEEGAEVNFLTMSYMVDIDGKFYSRSCKIGDGATYFEYDTDKGAVFVGDFRIGEDNQNAGNDLWESLQKNRTYHQTMAPESDDSYTLREGDMWYDFDDDNHAYRYNGDVWVSCRDGSIVNAKNNTFIQPNPPTSTEGKELKEGDMWYDSSDGNKPYVFMGGAWVEVSDGNLSDLVSQAQTQIEGILKELKDISSDNVLTPNEKQTLLKEWEIIKIEYPKNVSKANSYGVVTTAYVNAYNVLNAYVPPLVANMSANSNIVGDTFRSNFKDYYDAEITLTGNIYDKVKESAVNDSKKLISELEIKMNGYMADGVLNEKEKAELRAEINIINNRFTILSARATLFNVGIVTLTNYRNVLITWRDGILSQSGVFSDTVQVNTLRQAFANYLIEEEKTYDLIEKKAKELADNAQKDANGALNLLSDIASDNKVTPSEKQQTKKELDIIVAEYQKILEECKKFGVSTSDYTLAYNRLRNFLNTTILNNMTTTTEISGDTFRNYFSDYYTNRQIVLNGISSSIPDISSLQNGKMLYLDPTFKNGVNSIKVYNNSNNGLVTHALQTGAQFGVNPPNDTNKVLVINKAVGTTSPNLGGFYFGTTTKAGMRLCSKIVACIPVGFKLAWTSNATGNDRESYWVTEVEGTGKFKEYMHVLKCGTEGTFSTTSFFYLVPNDGNSNQAVKWGVSYATVFDSGGNQNEYVTEALGNAKIFYSPSAPTSGMKQNDLWYDTDDMNHPYIFNGSIWVSARDRIFETEGGNNVYFQSATPPTNGSGVSNGDMWFNTGLNNTLYVLIDGKWTLGNDAMDKIAKGNITLNGNTNVEGSFKVTGAQVQLNANTSINGMLSVFGANGLTTFSGTTEANSKYKTIIKGGVIEFWENV